MSKKKTTTGAPEGLTGNALLAWHDFAADAADLITAADRGALILLAKAWAEMEDAERHIEKHGTVVKAPNGYPGSNPYCRIRNDARACVIKLMQELALTPNSRSRIEKHKGSEAEEADAELEF